jgi:hypothetical protein
LVGFSCIIKVQECRNTYAWKFYNLKTQTLNQTSHKEKQMSLSDSDKLMLALHANDRQAGNVRHVAHQCLQDLRLIQQVRTKPVDKFRNEIIDQRLEVMIAALQRLVAQVSDAAASTRDAYSTPAALEQLKLKHGKTYLDRDGDKVTVHLVANLPEYPFVNCEYPFVNCATGETFTPEGAWQLGHPSRRDLVSECDDPPVTNPSQGETK